MPNDKEVAEGNGPQDEGVHSQFYLNHFFNGTSNPV
jgi:hypothetical protein